jgi:hypothetical protein
MSFLVEKGRALVNHVRGEGGSSFENDDEQTCSMSERRVSLVTVTTSDVSLLSQSQLLYVVRYLRILFSKLSFTLNHPS